MSKQIIGDVRVYSRHSEDCDRARGPGRKEDPSYLKCDCPKWMQWRVGGKTIRESAGTRSFAGVKLAAEKKTKELRGEAVSVEPAVNSVESAVKDWLRFRETNGLNNDRTNDRTEYLGGKLVAWCKENGVTFLHQLTTGNVIQFRSSLPYKTTTSSSLKVHWSIICGFFNWAHATELIAKNPASNTLLHPTLKIRFKKPEVVPPTSAEVDRVFAAVDQTSWDAETKHRVRLFALTERWTGMAIMDTATLQRDKLDADNRIRGNRRKTGERFKVRIPSWLADQLRVLPRSKPEFFFSNGDETDPYSIRRHYLGKLHKLFEIAEVKMTSHSFRHFFITEQLAKGWSVDDVSTMVGTSPREIRKTYHHWIKEDDERMDAKWREQGLDAMPA